LTPDEFVRAGDQLVRNCPSWQWVSGDPDKLRSYLPRDKQFLITKRVNCVKRIAQLRQNTVDVDVAGGLSGDGNEAWCATELRAPCDADTDVDAEEDAVVISTADLTLDNSGTIAEQLPVTGGGGRIVSTAASLVEEEFEDDSLDIGSYAVTSGVLRSRKYDLSITYDNYYRTPRIWLFGWDEVIFSVGLPYLLIYAIVKASDLLKIGR
jgi:ubiquitin-like-conjugating enzyme ATG3